MSENTEAGKRFVDAAEQMRMLALELRAELDRVSEDLVNEKADLISRRVLVRSQWAYMEALAYCLKRFTLAWADTVGIELITEDRVFLEDL